MLRSCRPFTRQLLAHTATPKSLTLHFGPFTRQLQPPSLLLSNTLRLSKCLTSSCQWLVPKSLTQHFHSPSLSLSNSLYCPFCCQLPVHPHSAPGAHTATHSIASILHTHSHSVGWASAYTHTQLLYAPAHTHTHENKHANLRCMHPLTDVHTHEYTHVNFNKEVSMNISRVTCQPTRSCI